MWSWAWFDIGIQWNPYHGYDLPMVHMSHPKYCSDMTYSSWKESSEPVEVRSLSTIFHRVSYILSVVVAGYLNHQQYHRSIRLPLVMPWSPVPFQDSVHLIHSFMAVLMAILYVYIIYLYNYCFFGAVNISIIYYIEMDSNVRRTFVQQVYTQLSSPVAVWLDDCPCFDLIQQAMGKKCQQIWHGKRWRWNGSAKCSFWNGMLPGCFCVTCLKLVRCVVCPKHGCRVVQVLAIKGFFPKKNPELVSSELESGTWFLRRGLEISPGCL